MGKMLKILSRVTQQKMKWITASDKVHCKLSSKATIHRHHTTPLTFTLIYYPHTKAPDTPGTAPLEGKVFTCLELLEPHTQRVEAGTRDLSAAHKSIHVWCVKSGIPETIIY